MFDSLLKIMLEIIRFKTLFNSYVNMYYLIVNI